MADASHSEKEEEEGESSGVSFDTLPPHPPPEHPPPPSSRVLSASAEHHAESKGESRKSGASKFGNQDGGDDDDPRNVRGTVLSFPDGIVEISASETELYGGVFKVISNAQDDTKPSESADCTVAGDIGAAFLRRAKLDNDILGECGELPAAVDRAQNDKKMWYIACKLVALCQSGEACAMGPLFENRPLPLADFGIMSPMPDFSSNPAKYPPSACCIKVSTPTTAGSGMYKHNVYTIMTTNNSLDHLPKKMEALRRYSDVFWLHEQLCAKHPGTIVPPLTEKRTIGNMDAEFVERRRIGLEIYLNSIVLHRKLSACFEVQALLSAPAEGWECAKLVCTNGGSGPTLGPSYLNKIGRAAPSPDVAPSAPSFLQGMILRVIGPRPPKDSSLATFKKVLVETSRADQAYAKGFQKLVETLDHLGVALEDMDEGTILGKAAISLREISRLGKKLVDTAQTTLSASLRHEIGKVSAAHNLEMNERDVHRLLSDAKVELDSSRKRYSSARSSSKGDAAKIDAAKRDIVAAERKIDLCERASKDIKDASASEMAVFEAERAVTLKRMLGSYVEQQIEFCSEKGRELSTLRTLLMEADGGQESPRPRSYSQPKPGNEYVVRRDSLSRQHAEKLRQLGLSPPKAIDSPIK